MPYKEFMGHSCVYVGFYLGNDKSDNQSVFEWINKYADKTHAVHSPAESLSDLCCSTVTMPNGLVLTILAHYHDMRVYIGADYKELIKNNKEETEKLLDSAIINVRLVSEYEATVRESLRDFPEITSRPFEVKFYLGE